MDAHTFSYAFKSFTSDCREAISASFSDMVFWRTVIFAEAVLSSVVVTFLEDDVLLDVNKTVLLITGCIRPNLNALNFL